MESITDWIDDFRFKLDIEDDEDIRVWILLCVTRSLGRLIWLIGLCISICVNFCANLQIILCEKMAERGWELIQNNAQNGFQNNQNKPFIQSNVDFKPAPKKRSQSTTESTGQRMNKSEEICRSFLESELGYKFPSIRPDFLKNPKTNRNLELDGYCQELRLAFEYQGKQHYEFTPNFQSSVTEFCDQVGRDGTKQLLCAKFGIRLIIVPPLTDKSEIEKFLRIHIKTVEKNPRQQKSGCVIC